MFLFRFWGYGILPFLLISAIGFFASLPVRAEFLQMPEIIQMRDLRKDSLLRDVDIPPVRERDPDPEGGPRLAVSEFRIQGLVEYPDLGITRETIKQLTEQIRFELMEEGKQLESGYTIRELGELSDLLIDIEEESTERHVTPLDVQRLVWLVREQRGKRGITIGQIESVANTITRFYRERGFVLAKAYIPKQQVRDGIVNLTLLLGMLGEVDIHANEMYDAEDLQAVFKDMMGMPVTSAAVEENLFLINNFPGITVDGYFEPGYQVGDTRLNINVKNESRYNANVRVDNHGTEESGLYRLYADAQVNNMLGMADMLHASYLRAEQPANTNYYRLNYELNLFHPRFRFGLETSKNQFIVDQSAVVTDIDLKGDVLVNAANLRYLHRRSRTNNQTYELRYEEIESDLQIGNIPDINNANDEKLGNTSLGYYFDFLQEEKRRLHQGRLKLTSGSFVYGADPPQGGNPGQDTSYATFNADYSMLAFWKVPLFEADTRLIYRTNLQYSGKNLSTIMRFSLAGPTRARAYSPSTFTADDALYLGVDWIFNSPAWFDFNIAEGINFRNITKPFVFADYSYGLQHTLRADEEDGTAQLVSAGFGLQFSHGNAFSGNLMAAFPVSESFKGTASAPEIDDYRIVFDFQYSF